MQSQLTVNQARCGSIFCGQQSTTFHTYVGMWPGGTLCFGMNLMVSMPVMSLIPCVKQLSSLANGHCQRTLDLGRLIRCQYSNGSPVVSSMLAYTICCWAYCEYWEMALKPWAHRLYHCGGWMSGMMGFFAGVICRGQMDGISGWSILWGYHCVQEGVQHVYCIHGVALGWWIGAQGLFQISGCMHNVVSRWHTWHLHHVVLKSNSVWDALCTSVGDYSVVTLIVVQCWHDIICINCIKTPMMCRTVVWHVHNILYLMVPLVLHWNERPHGGLLGQKV